MIIIKLIIKSIITIRMINMNIKTINNNQHNNNNTMNNNKYK